MLSHLSPIWYWLPLVEGAGLSSTYASDIVGGVRMRVSYQRLNRGILSVQPQELRSIEQQLWIRVRLTKAAEVYTGCFTR